MPDLGVSQRCHVEAPTGASQLQPLEFWLCHPLPMTSLQPKKAASGLLLDLGKDRMPDLWNTK